MHDKITHPTAHITHPPWETCITYAP